MRPEQILQSQFIDILFDNRNKEYGAYALRKGYNMRLVKAIVGMLLLALAVCLFLKWKVDDPGSKALLPLIYMKEVTLENVKEKPVLPKEPEPAKAVPVKKSVEQIDNMVYAIVEDHKADKKIHTVEELDGKLSSTISSAGNPFDGVPVQPAEIIGKVNVVAPLVKKEIVDEGPRFTAQVMPEFPGGKEGLMRYMVRNLKEPDHLQAGERFVVMVRFVVDVNGIISNAEIIKSGGEFDKEVLKVINKMPRWKPGMQDGKLVSVYFQMPVTFEGQDY